MAPGLTPWTETADNFAMRIPFTKMQGAGNDFVLLDETRGLLGLSEKQYRFLADRHFGVGADQILSVRPSPAAGVDFEYVIHNADGGEVEHCGNGARCFVRFVREQGLTDQVTVRVKVAKGLIELTHNADGRVTVDMGPPMFALPEIPFDAAHAQRRVEVSWEKWRLSQSNKDLLAIDFDGIGPVDVAVLSMGNPHAVWVVPSVDTAPLEPVGRWIESHPAFPRRVNAGFLEVLDRRHVKLRVYERGAGETLACGTGACAAVVAGIRLGLLDTTVDVQAPGGRLTIAWAGQLGSPVLMTGPATTVFRGEIDVPHDLA